MKGESVAIAGANGAGKSTLLFHLNGIFASPAVSVCGLPAVEANLKAIRRKVGLVFQNPDDQLFCPTVFDDVAFGPRNMGLSKEEVDRRVSDALRTVGMEDARRRNAFHLSVGQKKRVAIATAFSMGPEVLALDEPTANLDPKGRRELLKLLSGRPETKIIASHDFGLLKELCTRVVVLSYGAVAADGEPRVLLSDGVFLAAQNLA
jgi:cobalt/nickel transport system ATP-binding protein